MATYRISKFPMMRKSLNSALLLAACIGMASGIFAQQPVTDLMLLREHQFATIPYSAPPQFMWMRSSNPIIRYNPVSLAFGAAMFFYQSTLSKQFSATCIYHPTCSNFGIQSIQRFGLIKGLFLTADRIMRCNRIAAVDIPSFLLDPTYRVVNEDIESFRLRK